MKNMITFILIIVLLFMPVILYAYLIADYQELKENFENEKIVLELKNQELEKDIRILKTDIQILQYGFPEKSLEE